MENIKKIISLYDKVRKEKTFKKQVELNQKLSSLMIKNNITSINREFYENQNIYLYVVVSEWMSFKFKVNSFKKLNHLINTIEDITEY